jgi:DNA mismatch endonuclease, patch repair protein
MQSNRGRDTVLEIELRRALHRAGYRFRKHRRPIRGLRCEADIVFIGLRLAVFVDGCFWHGCREHKTIPVAHGEWWTAKLNGNVARDRQNDELLRTSGWMVLRLWEHTSLDEMVRQVTSAVAQRRRAFRPPVRASSGTGAGPSRYPTGSS